MNSRPEKQKRAIDIVNAGLSRRYRSERRFRRLGIAAICMSLMFLALLFVSIISKGYSAFFQTVVKIDVYFDPEVLQRDALTAADYPGLVKKSLRTMFPKVKSRGDKRDFTVSPVREPAFSYGIWCLMILD